MDSPEIPAQLAPTSPVVAHIDGPPTDSTSPASAGNADVAGFPPPGTVALSERLRFGPGGFFFTGARVLSRLPLASGSHGADVALAIADQSAAP